MRYSILGQGWDNNWRKLFKDGYHHLTVDGQTWSLSLRDRELVERINRIGRAPEYLRRVAVHRWLRARAQPAARMKNGFAICTGAGIPGLPEALVAADRQFAVYEAYRQDPESAGLAANLQAYRAEQLKTEKQPLKHVPFRYDPEIARTLIRPFLSPKLYIAAADYLGIMPILKSVRIVYSANVDEGDLRSSQLMHLDPEGARQAKLFIAVRDVGPENSPLTIVPERQTLDLIATGNPAFTGKRVKDSKVLKLVPQSKWVSHQGPPGTTMFVDTSRCFHYGSRPSPKPRLLLYAQYLDPFCSVFPVSRKGLRELSKTYSFYTPQNQAEAYLLGLK